jgi:hypothetical protein
MRQPYTATRPEKQNLACDIWPARSAFSREDDRAVSPLSPAVIPAKAGIQDSDLNRQGAKTPRVQYSSLRAEHCGRSEAIQSRMHQHSWMPRRYASRNDDNLLLCALASLRFEIPILASHLRGNDGAI